MVQLSEADIQTREVLDWPGVNLFHYWGSSCSQKTRIFMTLKGVDWRSHEVDIPGGENYGPWYLGINPRGLVPTLVMNGEVHIESNDIILHLDEHLEGPTLVPIEQRDRMRDLLRHEDDLHLDLRTLSFRFTHPRGRAPKSAEALAQYKEGGSGTVGGAPDADKQREIDYWETIAENGITDEAVRASAGRFRNALDGLDADLQESAYLLGGQLTVLDIAWYIYVNRLLLCTYPLHRLHPNVGKWFDRLNTRGAFSSEVTIAAEIAEATAANHRKQAETGTRLVDVMGLDDDT